MADPIPVPTVAPAPTVSTVPIPTANTVYGATNIAQAATSPVMAPNPALDEYNAFLNTPDMIAARNSVSTIQNAINSEKQGLRNTTTGLEYQNDASGGTTGASINLIGRQVGRASELSSNRQAALGEQFSAASNYLQSLESTKREQYQIVQAEKQRIQAINAQTGGQAGILPTDTYEVAVQKAYKWQKKQDKKAEKKAKEQSDDDRKKALKSEIAKLGGSSKTKKGGTLSLKELEKEYNRLSGEAYKKSQIKTGDGGKSKNTAITALLTKAANMANGDTFIKNNAALYGLKESDLTPYTSKPNWGDGYRSAPAQSTEATGEVRKIMDALGVDAATAQKMILEEAANG